MTRMLLFYLASPETTASADIAAGRTAECVKGETDQRNIVSSLTRLIPLQLTCQCKAFSIRLEVFSLPLSSAWPAVLTLISSQRYFASMKLENTNNWLGPAIDCHETEIYHLSYASSPSMGTSTSTDNSASAGSNGVLKCA